jgi:hypothetical protein
MSPGVAKCETNVRLESGKIVNARCKAYGSLLFAQAIEKPIRCAVEYGSHCLVRPFPTCGGPGNEAIPILSAGYRQPLSVACRRRVPLTPKAFDVLRYLVEHTARVVSQDEILEAAWPETYVNPEVVKKHILEIRRVLGDQPDQPLFIATFPKRG